MNMLTDIFPLKVLETKVLSESVSATKKKALQATCILQKADEINQNGRKYPLDVIKKAVNDIQESVNNRSVKGQLGHPSDAAITLDRISHLVTKLWMEGKYVYGNVEVLEDMPCGQMFGTLLRNKVGIGMSSRGTGDMDVVNEGNNEYYVVKPGYKFVTWDVVSDPSVSQATISVMEGKNHDFGVMTRSTRARQKPAEELIREINNWFK